jgi:hypothetical protein
MFIDKGLNSTLVTPTGKVVNCRNGFGQVSIAQNGRDRAESPYWLSLTMVKFDDLRLVNHLILL